MTREKVTVPRELLRQVLGFCEIEPNNEKAMAAYDALRTALERPQDFQSAVNKRPVEADYTSHVAYTRALESYCDSLEQPAVEPVAELDLFVDENGPVLSFKPKWYGHLPNGNHKLYTAPQAQQPQEPKCNPHPKAPHGFDRNASHSADRYVCECESWDPYQAGYDDGFKAGMESEQALCMLAENTQELEQPVVEHSKSEAIEECLQVLRPVVKGRFPQEQALDELAGYIAAPQAQQPDAQQPQLLEAASAAIAKAEGGAA